MNCLDIITRAMRRIGVLASGELPQPDQSADALATLSAIYQRLISEGAFGEIRSYNVAGTIIAGENQRLILSDPFSVVALPETVPTYVSTFDPYVDGIMPSDGTRPVRDGAVVIVLNHVTNVQNSYIRDGATNTWVDVDNLDLTSPAPLSKRDANGLVCYLALEIADEYGQQPSEIVVRNAARWQSSICHNWSEPSPPSRGVYF